MSMAIRSQLGPRAAATAIMALLALATLIGCRGSAGARCDAAAAPCSGTGSLEHGGRTRTWRYHLPATAKADSGLPVVLAFHGRLGQGKSQEQLTGLTRIADERGFIVVYPDGVDRAWNDARVTNEIEDVDDVGFVDALIDRLIDEHRVDPRRIYANGFSNGALFVYRLACERGGRIVAISAGGAPMPRLQQDACEPPRAVPVMMFLGTEDPIVPFDGGMVGSDVGGDVLSAVETRDHWIRVNACSPDLVEQDEPDVSPDDGSTVTRSESAQCPAETRVVLYTVKGAGHTWPMGDPYFPEGVVGTVNQDVNASELTWEFFENAGSLPE